MSYVKINSILILSLLKVCKNDIKIEFFEIHENRIVWSHFAKICSNDVYKQTSIAFKIPPYKSQNIDRSFQVRFDPKHFQTFLKFKSKKKEQFYRFSAMFV